jgi:hypothetical protein
MKKSIGWWSLIALFAFSATANAQAASPPAAGDRFDGTYAFVSATTLNETYMTTWRTRMGRCGDIRKLGPLTVSNGSKSSLGVEIITRGTINGNGSVHARQIGRSCSYDLVWQKETR